MPNKGGGAEEKLAASDRQSKNNYTWANNTNPLQTLWTRRVWKFSVNPWVKAGTSLRRDATGLQ